MSLDINSLATEYTPATVQPEIKLWKALLLDGIRSLVLAIDSDAAAWLRLGRQVPASFELCCEMLDIDAERTRNGVMQLMALPEVSALRRLVAEFADASRRLGIARRRQWSAECWRDNIPALTAERDRLSRQLRDSRKELERRFGFTSQRCGGHPGNNGRRGWRTNGKHLTPYREKATVASCMTEPTITTEFTSPDRAGRSQPTVMHTA